MATIGTFTKDGTVFKGAIRTLTVTAPVTIEPVASKRGDKSPDYRVHCGRPGPEEIGAAWQRTKDGASYLSVRIDDPIFPAPIDCRLVKTGSEHGYTLLWERTRSRD